jgi:deoxyadenosine/deoxycytidine kinase
VGPHFEDVVVPLDDFYHQMERWSFNLQIYFLNSRFRQVMQIRESGKKIIKTEPFMKMPIFLPQSLFYGVDDQS